MARDFPERAIHNSNKKLYDEGWDRIFNKKCAWTQDEEEWKNRGCPQCTCKDAEGHRKLRDLEAKP